jgi:tetratricopeptide (TPR) repeat protein
MSHAEALHRKTGHPVRRRARGILVTVALLAGAFPALAQTPPVDRHAAADRLLDALKSAPTEQTASLVESHVVALWIESASPAVRLLLSRASREQQAGANQDAIEDFGAALALQPDLAEAWRQRADARFARGDMAGAVSDLREALRREPREFLAYRSLVRIAEARADWKAAFAAWNKLLAIDPKTPGGEQHMKELRRKAFGEET